MRDELAMLLGTVLKDATFDLDRVGIPQSGRYARRDGAPDGGRITVARYRELHERNRWDDDELRRAKAAAVGVAEQPMSDLVGFLRALLDGFIDQGTDRIGHAVPVGHPESMSAEIHDDGICDVEYASSLGNFAEGLVRGAAVLGADRIAREVSAWREGEPVRVRVCGVVDSFTPERAFALSPGTRVESLPGSSDALPAWLPERVMANDYLGRAVVSVDAEARPALYRPTGAAHVESRLPDAVDIEAVCRALSLECGEYAVPGLYVEDFGDLAAMSRSSHGLTWGAGRLGLLRSTDRLRQDAETGVMTLARATRSVCERRVSALLAGMDSATPSTGIAIDRWMRAMAARAPLADSLIDLRIALESVYLPRNARGMRLRLALTGAWHLGGDLAGRRAIYRKLSEIYRLASRAVHEGDVGEDPKGGAALSDGLELCRRAIVKMLTEDDPPGWEDVMLGAGRVA